jgi:tetratricopeptide (TPR) repeat protein
MVENQHGLGSILSFSAKSVNPKILEALLIGRKKIVDQLENRVKNIAKDGLNHQVLIIGARGTGKTHLLSVLHYRIQTFISQKKIKVAYFAEEEYGISGYLDFMVRILNAFIRWNEEDAEFLKSQLSILQETPPQYQEETIKRIIREYIGDNPLLILAENFNDIIDALKKEGQSKLRNWLQENNRISIIATSQALSDDIGKEDKPFYGFFDEISLKPLTLEESFQLLKSLAEIENRKDVIEHLENKGNAQVKAINTLVKGNHRLLITFYEFLKSDILSNLSVMIIKTLNDLKPYYETYIRYLPPQQQKILRFIALSKTPQMGTGIARECFIDQKSLSKQLSELNRKKLIDTIIDTNDKRNKLYDIAEPLLRISIEIGEQKEGISALFIDFLALYYTQNELKNQKSKFSRIIKSCIDPNEKQQYYFEINARERALNLQQISKNNSETYSIFLEYIKNKEFDNARLFLNKFPNDLKNDDFYFASSTLHYLTEDFDLSKTDVLKAIKINPNVHEYWASLGILNSKFKNYNQAETAFEKALKIDSKREKTLIHFGDLYKVQNRFEKAIKLYESALEINPKNEETISDLAEILTELNQYERAKIILEKLIKLNNGNDITWLRISLVYFNLKEYEKAVNASKRAIEIGSNIDVLPYVLLSTIYRIKKQHDKAVHLYYQIILIGLNNSYYDVSSIYEYVSEAVSNILKFDNNLDVKNCLQIEKSIIEDYDNANELKISLQLVKTYRKVILEKNKRALYQLPKEQREFFQKEIVDFREQQKS